MHLLCTFISHIYFPLAYLFCLYILYISFCKTPTASRGYDSSMTIFKCLQCYDVCRMVDSNLKVICPTRIRLHCRTNRCPSNVGSRLKLSTTPSHTKLYALRVPDLRYYTTSLYLVLLAIWTSSIIRSSIHR